jgi:hypothetical protein
VGEGFGAVVGVGAEGFGAVVGVGWEFETRENVVEADVGPEFGAAVGAGVGARPAVAGVGGANGTHGGAISSIHKHRFPVIVQFS